MHPKSEGSAAADARQPGIRRRERRGFPLFSQHKIAALTNLLAALPDEPQLSAQELKAYFDSSPEELRRAVNGVCDDGATLETKVNGIIARTFDAAVTEPMLDPALAGKLNAKADTAALTQAQAGLEQADRALQSDLDAGLARKCEIATGAYIGNGTASRLISLGFRAKAVLVASQYGFTGYGGNGYMFYGGLALDGHPVSYNGNEMIVKVDAAGFYVYTSNGYIRSNYADTKYHYIAFR